MAGRVMIVGAGEVGRLIARGLAHGGGVDQIVLAGLCQGQGPAIAALITTCSEAVVRFVELDGTRQADVESLLVREKPDVVVQSAALVRPWSAFQRKDPVVEALTRAGLGASSPSAATGIDVGDASRQDGRSRCTDCESLVSGYEQCHFASSRSRTNHRAR